MLTPFLVGIKQNEELLEHIIYNAQEITKITRHIKKQKNMARTKQKGNQWGLIKRSRR